MNMASVNTPANEHSACELRWQRVDALLGGTDAMRATGERLLPKFEKETQKAYERRLSTSVLFGGFEQTLSTMVGMPFAKPMAIGDDVPSRIKNILENVDQAGNNIDVFARESFRRGLAKGSEHILIDMDPVAPQSAADDLTRRPRWVPISAEQLIDGRKAMVNGVERFVHVRIRESVVEWDGYSQKLIMQVREIEPPFWKVWRKSEKEDSWFVFSEGNYSLPYVTLATFLAGEKKGIFTARSPLDNLASLNIAHWQSASDQRNILTVSRFAVLFLRGASLSGELSFGPFTVLVGDGDNADAKYVEHQGHAIQAGERDLTKLEELMESEGVRMITRRPGNITATSDSINEAQDQSELQSIARGMQDTLEMALQYTADWLDEPSGGSIELNSDYGIVPNANAIKDTVLTLRRSGDLAIEDAMSELKKAGLLSEGLDIEAAIERAAEDVARTLALDPQREVSLPDEE